MPTFKVNASIKVYFDREVAVIAASGEIDLLPDQLGGGFWSAYEAKSAS